MFYICCRVWKIETSIGQFMVHFFYNAHSKKLVFLILFPTDNTQSLFVGSDKGFKQRSRSYTGEWKEKIFEKVKKNCSQNTNICLMCLPTHKAIGEWKARRAVRQGTEGRTFSPHCHLNFSAILHFMSPLSPNIIWLIPRYTNMALLASFYLSTTTN